MAEPNVAAFMADIVATIKANTDADLGQRVVYPPTDQAPQNLVVILDYGPTTATASQFEEALHTITANVMVPIKGSYQSAYGVVTEAAQAVRKGMRGRVLADEATVVSVVQDRARAGTYAGVDVVATTVTWTLETKDEETTV